MRKDAKSKREIGKGEGREGEKKEREERVKTRITRTGAYVKSHHSPLAPRLVVATFRRPGSC